MNDRSRDPVLEAAIAELQRTEPVDAAILARVVRASVEAPQDDSGYGRGARGVARAWKTAAVVLMAAAAGFAGFLLRGAAADRQVQSTPNVSAAPAIHAALQPVDAGDPEAMPVPTQFVLQDRAAHRVALVGDFNGWSPGRSPMVRHDASSLWAITVPITPGRHLYAFMVDDSLFTLDPRQPAAVDKDIGAKASVIMVGRP